MTVCTILHMIRYAMYVTSARVIISPVMSQTWHACMGVVSSSSLHSNVYVIVITAGIVVVGCMKWAR